MIKLKKKDYYEPWEEAEEQQKIDEEKYINNSSNNYYSQYSNSNPNNYSRNSSINYSENENNNNPSNNQSNRHTIYINTNYKSKLGTAAFVLAIMSLCGCTGPLTAIPSLICAFKCRKKQPENGLAILSIVIAVISLIFFAIQITGMIVNLKVTDISSQ